MDGNVKRVLTRYFAIPGWPGQARVANELWEIAERLTPKHRAGDYTQVMMDLGATVCTRSRPACQRCPLADNCIAHQTGQEKRFPESKPGRNKPEKSTIMLIVINQYGEVLLEKRPPTGIWGGLWSFPEISDPEQITEQALEKTGLTLVDCHLWSPFRHTFSHYHLDITPVLSFVEYPGQYANTVINDSDSHGWFALNQSPELGLAAPVKKLLQQVESSL